MTGPEEPSNVDAPPPPPEVRVTPPTEEAPKRDPDNQAAVIALVLGIVGMIACQLAGPVALYLGWAYQRDAKIRGFEPDPMGMVGMILGGVSTVLFLFTILVTGGLCVLYAGGMFVALLLGGF